MTRRGWPLRVATVLAIMLAACASDGASSPAPTTDSAVAETSPPLATAPADTATVATDPPTDPEPPDTAATTDQATTAPADAATVGSVRTPGVEALTGGGGVIQPLASARLPDGYIETEFSITGDASAYEAIGSLGSDGRWEAAEGAASALFTTRVIVRTPPAEQFSGVVLVEWMNVTAGTDATPDWGYLHEMIGREGHAYVAVSAQLIGVLGDDESFFDGGIIDTRGLPVKDPARYGALDHPGDAYAFDIFTQAGVSVVNGDVLGGLEATNVIALGESQSAFFMTTYANAIHPLVNVFDGFLVHSRGATATNPDGSRPGDELDFVRIRTDLNVPVMQYATETDIFGLGFVAARQPDSDSVRTWEVAGTAHADAYSLFASGLERDAASGSILGCSVPINDGPQHETLAAAVHHLVNWVAEGTTPPPSPVLDVLGDELARDELGVATGGVRSPVVDAPLRLLTGAAGPDGGSCFLFGQTNAFDDGVVASLYGSLDDWMIVAEASADAAVEAGWLLPEDAASMLEEQAALAAAVGLS